jgi:hypothetical protein
MKLSVFKIHKNILLFVAGFFALTNCKDHAKPIYNYIKPIDSLKISVTNDTIHFPLDTMTYNAVKSFNYFIDSDKEFFAFYDKRSQSVNIFDFHTKALNKKVFLKSLFNSSDFDKTSVYVNTLNSMLVTNNSRLYSVIENKIVDSIDFQSTPMPTYATFGSTAQPIKVGNKLYADARLRLSKDLKINLSQWKMLYEFDLKRNVSAVYYNLPDVYLKKRYSHEFYEKSYCYNDRGNFVCSFPADSNIYETDLNDYHVAHYGKSKYQTGSNVDIKLSDKLRKENSQSEYLLSDSYKAIFFDSTAKRYLRVFKVKLNEDEIKRGQRRHKQSVMIFDKDLRIVGESQIEGDIALSSLIITRDGKIYARVKTEDDTAIHFTLLTYVSNTNNKFGE